MVSASVEPSRIWHVTLTVGGVPGEPGEVRSALDRLAEEQPFLVGGRYARDRVELDYWEEAEGVEDAAALALRLWGEHRSSAGLPPWRVLGLEVVERDVLASRGAPPPRAALHAVRGSGPPARWERLPE